MTNNNTQPTDARPLTSLESDVPRPTGLRPLGLAAPRDGLLYVPAGYRPEQPAPLVVVLHGAGSNAERGLAPLLPLADEYGMILLALDSRGRTWDIILGAYGSDVDFLDQALTQLFVRYVVDHTRIAVAGFSDGASYALATGIMNSDLFSHTIAFSPGFLPPSSARRCPQTFISHGTQDTVLPIARCSRRIVAQLRDAGCAVEYREFDGPHIVPPTMARTAAVWFVGAQQ